MRELVIMFTPNAAYEQIAALAQASVQVDDDMLAKRLEAAIYNIERRLEGQKPAPISVTDRLGDNDADILKIGELASKYHFEQYGCYPEKIAKRIGDKIVLVNRYTAATAPTTLDRAIKELNSLYFPFC
jgi:hypothetical protein